MYNLTYAPERTGSQLHSVICKSVKLNSNNNIMGNAKGYWVTHRANQERRCITSQRLQPSFSIRIALICGILETNAM